MQSFDVVYSTKFQQQVLFWLKQCFLNANIDFNKQILKINFFVWIVADNLLQLIIILFFWFVFAVYESCS